MAADAISHQRLFCVAKKFPPVSRPEGEGTLYQIFVLQNSVSSMIILEFYLAYKNQKTSETQASLNIRGFFDNAGDRDRTGTGIATHGILSPGRLPVPPRRHNLADLSQWMVVDSNHRSKLQQIYSLSPLATRETIHSRVISSDRN